MLYFLSMEQTDKQEILEAIDVFAESVDKRFDVIQENQNKMSVKIVSLEHDFKEFREEFHEMKQPLIAYSNVLMTSLPS